MRHASLTHLQHRIASGDDLAIEIHAVDPMIYQMFERRGSTLEPILEDRGTTARFPSRAAALAALQAIGVSSVEFVHRSAYDEMVGLDTCNADTELRERVVIQPA